MQHTIANAAHSELLIAAPLLTRLNDGGHGRIVWLDAA